VLLTVALDSGLGKETRKKVYDASSMPTFPENMYFKNILQVKILIILYLFL